MDSIIQLDTTKCFLCGKYEWLEEHHIFGGYNRRKSEFYGLKVKLCHWCHNEPPKGAHHNKETMQYLHEIGQRAFEAHYPEEDFMEVFGRNYI